jgi:23S rRNA (cytidine1920-2'-O)/16S rRNA (cytidine1409-2'-O)-methyltransferase
MPRRAKKRADEVLVAAGVAEDLPRARAMIMRGNVMITDGEGREKKIEKPGELVDESSSVRLAGEGRTFVSRAGDKLDRALETFAIDPRGWICADIGISTGGFTDSLLRRGAARVHGVDVAYGQVAWSIRNDPRVVLHERTNARTLEPLAFGERVRLAVVDVSFISLTAVLPAIIAQLEPDGRIVALVKPQFELSKDEVPGGVVRDAEARSRAIARVVAAARALDLELAGDVESSVPGADGNVEHLIHLVRK